MFNSSIKFYSNPASYQKISQSETAQLVIFALQGSVSRLSASKHPVIVSMVSAVLRALARLRTFLIVSHVSTQIGKAAPMVFRSASCTISPLKEAVTGSRTAAVRVTKAVFLQMGKDLLMRGSAWRLIEAKQSKIGDCYVRKYQLKKISSLNS